MEEIEAAPVEGGGPDAAASEQVWWKIVQNRLTIDYASNPQQFHLLAAVGFVLMVIGMVLPLQMGYYKYAIPLFLVWNVVCVLPCIFCLIPILFPSPSPVHPSS